MVENTGSIEALLQEDRTFPPPESFVQNANIKDPNVYEEAMKDPEAFWARFAGELDWFQEWDQVLDWQPPYAKWFIGGKLNASYNCVDRHLKTARRNKAAIIWEGEPGRLEGLYLLGPAPRGLPVCQRPQKSGRPEGRPG